MNKNRNDKKTYSVVDRLNNKMEILIEDRLNNMMEMVIIFFTFTRHLILFFFSSQTLKSLPSLS